MTRTALRRLLKSNGVSHQALANHLETDVRTVRRYLAGELPIPRRFEYAVRWALHIGVIGQNGNSVTISGRPARGGLDARAVSP